VKSAKDGLWTEQRMWLRSLLEVRSPAARERTSFKPSSSIPYPNQAGYLHYSNPYLFDAEGEALVKISICKVDFNLQAIT